MDRGKRIVDLIVLLLLVLGAARPAAAQYGAAERANLHASRAELTGLLAELEQAARSPARGQDPVQLRAEAAAVRERLQEGDFRAGDRIAIWVDGHPQLTDTLTVEPGSTITMAGIGTVPLRGVLRAELQEHLTQYLSQYIRDPRIRAESTVRLMVLGAVGNPGYYAVPSTAQITDVLALAGGTGERSQLTKIRIERDGRQLLAGRRVEEAIIAGRTIDQLSMRAGDRVVVPQRRNLYESTQLLWFGSSLVSAIVLLTQIF
jgi:protein involved in polysaccharide export with SLBB domain